MPNTLESHLVDTSTKYLSNKDQDAPLLLDEYGSLNNLLIKVLKEGYNEQIVSSFLLDTETSIGYIKLPLNHGFKVNQVVCISGAAEENFNGLFRVLYRDTSMIKVKILTEKYISSATTLTQITIKVAPLGYTIPYENEEEGVVCFKNKSLKSPAILKSIDKIPPNGYEDGWAKYSRVSIGQKIDSKGNFVNYHKAPYWDSYPDVDLTGNGVAGTLGIHGFAKWDYAIYSGNYSTPENAKGHGDYPTDWRIIGDDKTFYLMIRSMGRSNYSYNLLGYGEYISENPDETTSICLQARDGSISSESTSDRNYARTRNEFGVLDGYYGGFLFSNIFGKTKYVTNYGRYKCLGNYLSDTNLSTPWTSVNIKGFNPVTGKYYTSGIYIKDSDNYLRGYHRGVSLPYGVDPAEDLSGNLDQIILRVQTPIRGSSSFQDMPLIFSLKDWE